MRRYAVLLALLLAAIYWLQPWLRHATTPNATAHPWLPAISPSTWSAIALGAVVVAVVVGLILLVRFGLFVWRELGD